MPTSVSPQAFLFSKMGGGNQSAGRDPVAAASPLGGQSAPLPPGRARAPFRLKGHLVTLKKARRQRHVVGASASSCSESRAYEENLRRRPGSKRSATSSCLQSFRRFRPPRRSALRARLSSLRRCFGRREAGMHRQVHPGFGRAALGVVLRPSQRG